MAQVRAASHGGSSGSASASGVDGPIGVVDAVAEAEADARRDHAVAVAVSLEVRWKSIPPPRTAGSWCRGCCSHGGRSVFAQVVGSTYPGSGSTGLWNHAYARRRRFATALSRD